MVYSKSGGGVQTNNYPAQLPKPGAPFLRVLCARRCPERSRRGGAPRLHASTDFRRTKSLSHDWPHVSWFPYPIPPSATLPTSRQVLPFPLPHREVNKAIYFLATILLPVWSIYRRHTVKWIEPIERFVDAIVLLWLFDIIFKSVSRSSERLQNGLTKA